jgi:hypothetical protein
VALSAHGNRSDKTDRMKLIEIERGESLEELLPRLIKEKGSVRAAAEALDVWPSVISRWLKRLGLEVTTEITVQQVRTPAKAR